MKKKVFKYSFGLTLFLSLISMASFAQGPPPPPATPIDGGLAILLAAIGGYAVKKVMDYRKKK